MRRERAHPGAQPSFTDHDGHRFQAVLTDQPDPDIQILERRQRQRAHAETQIRNDKDTGLRNLPFRDFEHNRVWLMLVGIAHDLLTWTQRLLLTGELARAEPKRLRYRLLHVAHASPFTPAHSHATPRRQVALGRRARRCVHTRPSAPRDHLTTRQRTRRPASPRRPGATSRCPRTTPRTLLSAFAATTPASTTLTHAARKRSRVRFTPRMPQRLTSRRFLHYPG